MRSVIIPTEHEMALPMLSVLPGTGLDTEIERAEGKGYFFVEMQSFVEITIEKLGCDDTIENRSRILRAFLKMSQELIFAIMENQIESSQRPGVA